MKFPLDFRWDYVWGPNYAMMKPPISCIHKTTISKIYLVGICLANRKQKEKSEVVKLLQRKVLELVLFNILINDNLNCFNKEMVGHFGLTMSASLLLYYLYLKLSLTASSRNYCRIWHG